jgi:predicted TIM-barrel fold metal-dependent hydrolase
VEIVDAHAHVISRDCERYPLDPVDGTMSAWARERPVDGDGMVSSMDAAEIARTILVTPSTAYGYDNTYVAAVAAARPDRFGFVGAIDVRRPDARATMTRWVRERGMRGFRLFVAASRDAGDGAWLDDPATFPGWQAAEELGITISVHAETPAFPALRGMLERFPRVAVALDHCGLPPLDDGPPYDGARPLFELASAPNLHVKLSSRNLQALAAMPAGARPFVERLVAAFGARRVLWASNFPSSPGSLPALRDLATRELAFLSSADRAAIFHDTAQRLYRLSPRP